MVAGRRRKYRPTVWLGLGQRPPGRDLIPIPHGLTITMAHVRQPYYLPSLSPFSSASQLLFDDAKSERHGTFFQRGSEPVTGEGLVRWILFGSYTRRVFVLSFWHFIGSMLFFPCSAPLSRVHLPLYFCARLGVFLTERPSDSDEEFYLIDCLVCSVLLGMFVDCFIGYGAYKYCVRRRCT